MATLTSAKALADSYKARLRRLKYGRTSIDAASKAAAHIAMDEAVALTSGPERGPLEFAATGHPFRKARLLSIGWKIRGGASTFLAFVRQGMGGTYRGRSGGIITAYRG